ncbi:MAG TPA: hypothetical protein VLF63_02410, partial [Patescibacteria group bacterium]|nr:hypothetical protein [Patescibacteria group bacterium]
MNSPEDNRFENFETIPSEPLDIELVYEQTTPVDMSQQIAEARLVVTDVLDEPVNTNGKSNINSSDKLTDHIKENASIDLEKSKFNVRDTSLDDIDELVKIDIESFKQVYDHYNQDEDSIRGELNAKFRNRYQKIGGKRITILEKNGEIVGFMASCPTEKTPEDFISWEDITDEGTLNNTYNKDGENVYVVTLSVLSSGTEGKSLLFAYQIGQAIKEGYKQAFFESRLPGLKQWVLVNHCSGDQTRVDNLSEEEKHNL